MCDACLSNFTVRLLSAFFFAGILFAVSFGEIEEKKQNKYQQQPKNTRIKYGGVDDNERRRWTKWWASVKTSKHESGYRAGGGTWTLLFKIIEYMNGFENISASICIYIYIWWGLNQIICMWPTVSRHSEKLSPFTTNKNGRSIWKRTFCQN